MTTQPAAKPPARVEYPDTDGEPMAENTVQYEWIVKLKGNLDACLADFVAGDLFWYPVEGDNRTRVAPDVLVAVGRPKGDRKFYLQWEENGLPPKVVFEIWSPSNTFVAQYEKVRFYDKFGVDEFYSWDPERRVFGAFIRANGALEPVATAGGFVSPLLGVRFLPGDDLEVFRPDGSTFLSFADLDARVRSLAGDLDEASRQRDEASRQRDEASRQRDEASRRCDEASRQRDEAEARANALAEKLRSLGIDPG